MSTPSLTTVGAIVAKARLILIDADGTRWTDTELISWVTDAERATVMAIPSAGAVVYVASLASGTRQSIPAAAYQLLSAKRNMASNGTTPGRAVRLANQELLDAFNPDWHSTTAEAVVQNYLFDPQDNKAFHVFPPNDGTGKLEIVYAVFPAVKTALTDVIDVADIYQPALINYVLYRAFQKDGDYTTGMSIAMNYLQLFITAIGATEQGSLSNNPNLGQGNFDPSAKGSAR